MTDDFPCSREGDKLPDPVGSCLDNKLPKTNSIGIDDDEHPFAVLGWTLSRYNGIPTVWFRLTGSAL